MAANKKKATARHTEDTPVKFFLDMIAPSVVQFNPDHFICGNTFRCVWVLREYPTQTDEQALLRHLGEKDGITLRIYTRQLTPAEEKRIIQNAANKNRMGSSNTNDLQQTITAESNLQDMISMEGSRHRNKEPLLHCAVYIELTASDHNTLKLLQTDVLTELVRSKLNVDRLLLRQQQGFCCASPVGYNAFGQQFERVLPASSVANLYPFNYSGKTDAKGFYVGRDKYGSNVLPSPACPLSEVNCLPKSLLTFLAENGVPVGHHFLYSVYPPAFAWHPASFCTQKPFPTAIRARAGDCCPP